MKSTYKTTKAPTIIFRFASIYNQQWKNVYDYKMKKGEVFPYKFPSNDQIKEYIEKIKPFWRKIEEKVLSEMAEVIGFGWDDVKITCYVVGGGTIPFSEPLTVPVYKQYPNYFIDMLTHELIHQLFNQATNEEKTKKIGKLMDERYPNKTASTKIHIPILAVHTHLYKKIIGEDRLKINIREFQNLPDYKAAWDTVQKESYEKIIWDINYTLGM